MTIALACVLSSSALAGDIPSGGAPLPPPTAAGDGVPVGSPSAGEIPSVGAPSPGEIPISGYAEQAALSSLLAVLGLLV
jgi:hypothetical protein